MGDSSPAPHSAADASSVGAVILAAGRSSRMGHDKALLSVGPKTLLEHQLTLFAPLCDVLVVVVSPELALDSLALPPHVSLVTNPHSAGPMLSSAQLGLGEALESRVSGCFLSPVDAPLRTNSVLHTLADHWRQAPRSSHIPSYRGSTGHPVLLSRKHMGLVLALDPALHTARDVLRPGPGIKHVDCDSTEVLANLNTPEDWRKWLERGR